MACATVTCMIPMGLPGACHGNVLCLHSIMLLGGLIGGFMGHLKQGTVHLVPIEESIDDESLTNRLRCHEPYFS